MSPALDAVWWLQAPSSVAPQDSCWYEAPSSLLLDDVSLLHAPSSVTPDVFCS